MREQHSRKLKVPKHSYICWEDTGDQKYWPFSQFLEACFHGEFRVHRQRSPNLGSGMCPGLPGVWPAGLGQTFPIQGSFQSWIFGSGGGGGIFPCPPQMVIVIVAGMSGLTMHYSYEQQTHSTYWSGSQTF